MNIVYSSADYTDLFMTLIDQITNYLPGRCHIIDQYGRHPGIILIGISHNCRGRKVLRKTVNHSGMTGNVYDTVHHMGIHFLQHRIQYRVKCLFIIIPGILPSGIHTQVSDSGLVPAVFTTAHNTFDDLRRCEL